MDSLPNSKIRIESPVLIANAYADPLSVARVLRLKNVVARGFGGGELTEYEKCAVCI